MSTTRILPLALSLLLITVSQTSSQNYRLDTSFADRGATSTSFGTGNTEDYAKDIYFVPSRILVVGYSNPQSDGSSINAAQYVSNTGELDPTFGTGGIATVPGQRVTVTSIRRGRYC